MLMVKCEQTTVNYYFFADNKLAIQIRTDETRFRDT